MSDSHKRPTIGFITANLHTGASRLLWPGIVDAAQQRDVNLLCFPGGGLSVQADFESQRNALYDLVNADNVDGLVSWASTVGVALDRAEVARFHQRYRPLPMISLALPMEGIPALSVNSYDGMRAAVVHLIEVHGLRRLAFIRGPESHYYAQERYRAYTDVLREYGIPFDPQLVTRPVHWEAGVAAIEMLLDERGLHPSSDFQAVVAVSDLLALGAMKTLQARGFQVPGDVAVVGFNDSAEGRLTTPPLTSVTLPFYEQGYRAVEALLAQLAGEPVPDQVLLPSSLIVRQSCGCAAQSVMQAAVGRVPNAAETFERDVLIAELSRAGFGERAAPLLDAFSAELRGEASGIFVSALENILRHVTATDGDVAAWQTAISILRRRALPHLAEQARATAEDLFGQARVLIGETAQRVQAYQQLQAERQAETLREIGQALITTFDVDKLADVLAERLPALGIASCYLALYEHPASLEQANLVLAYTEQGRVPLESGGQRFASRQLVPPGLLPQRRYSLVVEPLYFRDEPIGFALFELGPCDGTMYEVLRAQISSALKGDLLFGEAQSARLAAEKADRIKTRLLANVSHELRTPLNIILGYTQAALSSPTPYNIPLPQTLVNDLAHIQHNAEHQLRVINDLLDLSRAEIDELDLYPELLDPRPLLDDAFHSLADQAASDDVTWRLQLPDRLPMILADPVRLRQILLNLLSNARKFTERGHITLGAEVAPPHLHLWVQDTGLGVPADQQERIFEPFVTAEHDHRQLAGIGLGLSITRRLVMLHCGSMSLESAPGQGSTFHVYLPLPSLGDQAIAAQPATTNRVLLLISASDQPTAEMIELCQRQGLELRRLDSGDDLEAVLRQVQPAALAWDLSNAAPADWAQVRRLRNHPRLCQSPFLLYGSARLGLTSVVLKPASGQALLDAINAACPPQAAGSILIVDDDPRARLLHQQVVREGLPGYAIRTAENGHAALESMMDQAPSLVLLDLMMPGMDGFDVLDKMRAEPRTRHVPVVILSNKLITLEDVKRLEQHALVTLQSKGILSETEVVAALNRALFGVDTLPQQTSALVKRAVAYLHQNYARPLARWEIAEAIGVSEDYLSRVFNRELGLSPWDYLNRYRVEQAKQLLRRTHDGIGTIAHQVGFKDQLYFSRVFRKVTGVSPKTFRGQAEM